MSKLIKQILILLIGLFSVGFVLDSGFIEKNNPIEIQWIDILTGDFNFRKKWNYPEGVYKNKFGQLVCEGICPNETELMQNIEGKIYTDSLDSYYQLVDTTHLFHSILCDAWCYEWAGTNFITIKQINTNQIICSTQTNAGTHCSLILDINNDTCFTRIELNSVSTSELKTYYCKKGFIKIDKSYWLKGILKSDFEFDFINSDEPNRKIFWKGKIFQSIEKQYK